LFCDLLFSSDAQFLFRVSISVVKNFFLFSRLLQFSRHTQNNNTRKHKKDGGYFDGLLGVFREREQPDGGTKGKYCIDTRRASFFFFFVCVLLLLSFWFIVTSRARARERERERFLSRFFFLPPQQKKKDLRARRMNCVYETFVRIPSRMR
jgi:hypothetical protein